jgi:AbrB family looped-hinge helix DNA binding protein
MNGILNTIMATTVEIDKAGRIVVPKKLRDALHLSPGTKIRVERNGHTLVLDADFPQATLVIENGVPLIYPAGGENAPVRDLQFFNGLQSQILAERDRHNSGLYDDEFEA